MSFSDRWSRHAFSVGFAKFDLEDLAGGIARDLCDALDRRGKLEPRQSLGAEGDSIAGPDSRVAQRMSGPRGFGVKLAVGGGAVVEHERRRIGTR